MGFVTRSQHMGVAALLLAVSIFLSRFMGLIRDKVISWHFGASIEADVYFAAFVIPDFINYLLAGGYFSITLIPLLSLCFEKNNDDGWNFFSAALCWVSGSILLLTCIAWWQAPFLAHLAAPGFSVHETARLTTFLRIILPAQACFLPGACLTALLYQRKQFVIPALTPLVYNGCIIIGGLLFVEQGMEGFCWGVLAGAVLGSFMLPLWAVSTGGISLRFVVWHPMLRRFLLLALPLMIGQSIVVLDEQFIRIFGSLAGEGAVSLLNYARRIMLVPVGVVAQAAGVASYPFLAALAAKGDDAGFDTTLNTALRNSVAVIIPLAAWMIATAEPILRLIFEGGDFGSTQTLQATPLLQMMLCGVFFWAVQQVVGRGFYARQDTIFPALLGTVATIISLPLYWILGKSMGAFGVAIAGVSAVVLYTLMLVCLWCKRYGNGGFARVISTTVRSILLTLPAASCAWLVALWLPQWGMHYVLADYALIWTMLALGGSLLTFMTLYLPLAYVFLPDSIRPLVGRILSRLHRSA